MDARDLNDKEPPKQMRYGEHAVPVVELLQRHQHGDYGEIDPEAKHHNQRR